MAGYLFGQKFDSDRGNKTGQYFSIGRVTSIVLGKFKGGTKQLDPDYKSPSDIGKIKYELLYSPLGKNKSKSTSDTGNKPAFPMSGFIKQYPIVGEIVLIMTGPSPDLNDDYNSQRLYYFPPYSLWNDSNHNAFPDLDEYTDYINKYGSKPGYAGPSITGSNMPLGYTFDERFVRNLQPFEGDIIVQSRFGQSIRFGSTVSPLKEKNSWSNFGNNGDPITIITNQQGNRPGLYKFDPTVEDINRDGASIYMTSTQQIDIPALVGFPLASFGVSINPIGSNTTEVIKPPINNEYISADEQDKNATKSNTIVDENVNNRPEQTRRIPTRQTGDGGQNTINTGITG